MNIEALIQAIIGGKTLDSAEIQQLTADEIEMLVEGLKTEADRHWYKDPNISLHCGKAIIHVGELTGNGNHVGLGTMACGDALRHLHRTREAWDMLNRAGEIYLQASNEVGWARTCIGKLVICVELNETENALKDANEARAIFLADNNLEKLLRLEVNISLVLNHLREFSAAIEKLHEISRLIERMGEVNTHRLVFVYSNLGQAHQGLGNLHESLYWYEQARKLRVEHGEPRGIALIDLYIINLLQALGQNKKALLLLHETLKTLEKQGMTETILEVIHLIECYLYFKRYADALNLIRKAVEQHPPDDESLLFGLTLLYLAIVEIEMGNLQQALDALRQAEQIFECLKVEGWLGVVHLYRGQAALRHDNLDLARYAAKEAANYLQYHEQPIYSLMALLMSIRAEINHQSADVPLQMAFSAQKMARQLHIPHLRYEAHVLSGQIAEQTGKRRKAIKHYQLATGIMEQIQRSLVLTSRAEFLVDKQESVQSLMRLYLEDENSAAAFATLERSKAQIWLGYLSQLDHLRWLNTGDDTAALIDELSRLREEHYWYYRVAHDQMFREQQHVHLPADDALIESHRCEHEITTLIEQLYLHSNREHLAEITPVAIEDIQAHLDDNRQMIAYYSDGKSLTAFLLDGKQLRVFSLPTSVATVEKLLNKWQSNINRALRTVPASSDERILASHAQTIAKQLYSALLQPLEAHLEDCQRLYIVPYGVLHYLPFHLLHNQEGYLVERLEAVMLPTASLITRQTPRRERGALAIAYSWDGRLRYSAEEADAVQRRFGGETYIEDTARIATLNAPPCQILHISAHGQYRMDEPNFSYIQLADGPLYTDDLFQYDLQYELVTLSACETGRSYAAAGDELIGLGRGFLFAGAGALIASLWRVDETLTLELMDELYSQLDYGASKPAALRSAQLALMQTYPGMHPAFWGAFEHIGNADSLDHTN